MSMMQNRRAMMQMARGITKVTQIDVVATTTGETITIPYTLPAAFSVIVTIDEIPEPDSTRYLGLIYTFTRAATPYRFAGPTGTQILRPNGTYGTDAGWCGVESDKITIGSGQYGKCHAGSTYHVVIADMSVT